MNLNDLYFAKVKENGVIPSKKDEDDGYDLYACFDEEEIVIEPNEKKIIPTGIISAFDKKYGCIIKERGSTGINTMAIRAGVIEGSYRGEWLIIINNTGKKDIIISNSLKDGKVIENEDEIIYPTSKAIAQACFYVKPQLNTVELTCDEIIKFDSIRGDGKLGSSGK